MDRLADWVWRRWRRQFRRAVTAVAMFLTAGFALPSAIVVPAYFDLGTTEGLVMAAALVPAVVLVFALSYLIGVETLWQPVAAWCAGDEHDAARALRVSFQLPKAVLWRSVVIGIPVTALALSGWYVAVVENPSITGLAGLVIFSVAGALATRSLIGPILEVLFRPLRLEASVAMREISLDPELFGSRLGSRILSKSAAIAWASGLVVPAIALSRGAPDTRFAWTMAGLLAVVAAYGLAILRPVAVAPILRPIEDLTSAARRIARGRYDRTLPVTSDDELGELVGAFNEMRRGLSDRERLRSAFGSYVDPALATRLLEQENAMFSGERVEVTVLFADIRDFTPFAEAHPAEDAVARLNALFETIVPVIADHGGHTNKFLGDGAMAVFGAPARVDDHADRALAAALEMQRRIRERFDHAFRVGIGINTGTVIAGTIGGGGKLEFTLIGDAVNVAARVEQLTKTTRDDVLLTDATRGALRRSPIGLVDRGNFALKGKAAPVGIHALNPASNPETR